MATLILADKQTGPQVAVVTNIAPLYSIVSLDSVDHQRTGRAVCDQSGTAGRGHSRARAVPCGIMFPRTKNPIPRPFALVGVKGPPENPDALV